MASDQLGLSSAALPMLRDLIHERTGLYYGADRLEVLGDRLAPLVLDRGFQSYLDYYYLLKYDPLSSAEWEQVMDALSVPETYFWREIDQLRALVSHVVPALAEAAPHGPLRVWSVPCASGEEPLTLAMLLEEAGWFARVPIEIYASDASPAQIARARGGRYRDRAFRALPPELRERYFQRAGDAWVVDPSLHARVRTWTVVNLAAAEQVVLLAHCSIVICRNVFIYFSAEAMQRVVESLGRAMPVPGYLCVGASESLLRVTSRFQLEEIGGAFMYVKRA